MRGQTDLRSLVRKGVGPTHQLPRNVSSVSGLSILSAGHTGTPYASKLRQQVRGVIHKSTRRPRLEKTLHTADRPSCVGSEQSALTEGNACAWQNEPRSRHVVEEQCLFRGKDAPPARCSENLGSFGRARVDFFDSEDNSHCPIFFTKSTDALSHEWPSLPLYAYRRYLFEQRHKLILIAQ